jgi:hypothetical protein
MPLLQRVTGRREASAAAWSTLATARPRCTSKTTKIIMATTMATAISHVALSKEATLDALSKPTDLSDEVCPHVCDQPCG